MAVEADDGRATLPSDGDLIALIYQASAKSATWQKFLHALARRCNAHGATMFEQSFVHSNATIMEAVGIESTMQAAYVRQYAGSNAWVLAQQGMPAGTVVLSQDLVSVATLKHNQCYQEWHRPQDFDFAIGSNIAVTDGSTLKLGVLRSQIVGPMDCTHVMLLRTLMPHLQHALALAEQKRRLELQAIAFSALANSISVGTLVVDSSRRVVEMNDAANLILSRRDAFFLDCHAILHVNEREDERKLSQMLRDTASESPTHRESIGTVVRRKDGGQPYFVEALKLGLESRESRGHERTAKVLLSIRDPDRRFGTCTQVLEAVLNLTPAEAKLATCLAQGLTLRQAAHHLTVTESTARFVAKRVLSKAACHRQSDLVRLVVALSR